MIGSVFKAGYLPGLRDEDVSWQRLQLGDPQAPLWVDLPQITPEQVVALAQRIRQASREQLHPLRTSEIIAVLDRVTARLLDPQDVYRRQLEQMLPRATGFNADMVRLNLNTYLQTFRALQLQRFVAEDFANPKMLDEFQPRVKGGWSKAMGPDLLVHVWAGNVPALPLWSWVSGLLVKAGSIGKVSRSEPLFASLYARLLAEVAPHWADCFAVVWWPGDDANAAISGQPAGSKAGPSTEQCAFAQADVVMAYGGNAALSAMQSRMPVTTRFLPHGHKLSFGVVSARALSVVQGPRLAQQAARDVARYDQQGCYSPHVFYVQRGGSVSPVEFAQHLATALAALQHKWPHRVADLEEATACSTWREAQAMASVQGRPYTVMGTEADWGCVVFIDEAVPLSPGPLNRHVRVVAVDSLAQTVECLSAHRNDLQTAGLAAAPEELLHWGESLGRAGVTRICALGSMTAPEAGWHHDGRFSLLDLVRMVDIDESTERSAEHFTQYEV